jgi:hypothetical protein
MKRSLLLAMTLALATLGSLSTAYAARDKQPKPGIAKADTWAVVQIGDEVKIIKSSELKNLQKTAKEEYEQDMKAYKEAQKESSKSKDKVSVPKPVKHSPRILKRSCKTEQDANDARDKILEEREGKDKSKAKEY